MKFVFQVIAQSFPAICLVAGVALFVFSFLGLGFWAGLFGVILVVVAICLYIWNRSRG